MLHDRDEPRKNQAVNAPAYDPGDICLLHASRWKNGRRPVLTKTWYLKDDRPKLKDYDGAKFFQWELVRCASIRDLHTLLLEMADDPHCLVIRGQPLDAKSRKVHRRHAHPDAGTNAFFGVKREWVVVDLDKIALPPGLDPNTDLEACEDFLLDLLAEHAPETRGVTCVIQRSSSAGMRRGRLSLHAWFWLAKPHSDAELKRWAKAVNARAEADGLPKLLDISLFSPTQPHYVASPIFKNGIADLIGERIVLLEGDLDKLTPAIPDKAEIAALPAGGGGTMPAGLSYRECLDRIGDQSLGCEGFQEPIKHAAREAVWEAYGDPDIAAVVAEITTLVKERRGSRTAEEIDRYADTDLKSGFAAAKLRYWQGIYANRERDREAQRHKREEARQAAKDQKADEEPASLDKKRQRLREVVEYAVDEARDHRDMCREFRAEWKRIVIEVDHGPKKEGGDRERRKRLAVESGALKARLARKYGFEHFEPRAPATLAICLPGLGKTRAILETVARKRHGRVEIYPPTHKLARQLYNDLLKLHPHLPVHLIYGRSADDLNGHSISKAQRWRDEEGKMCPRHQEAGGLSDAGVSIKQALCGGCPLAKTCGYLKQFEGLVDGHGIVIMAHAYLQRDRPEEIGQDTDLVVIDEDPTNTFFSEIEIEWAMLEDGKRIARMAEDWSTFGRAERAFFDLAKARSKRLNWRGPAHDRERIIKRATGELVAVLDGQKSIDQVDIPALKRAAEVLEANRKDIDLSGLDKRYHYALAGLMDGKALMALIRQVLACRKRKFDARRTTDIGKEKILMQVFTPPALPKAAPLIVLDATADARILSHVFERDFERRYITMQEKVRITQVTDVTGSKTAIQDRNSKQPLEIASEEEQARDADRMKRIAGAVTRFAGGAKTLLIGHKEIVERLAPLLPENVGTLHFGGPMRGLNGYDGAKIVILGKQMVDRWLIERRRAALFVVQGDRDSVDLAPMTIEDYAKQRGIDELPKHEWFENEFGTPLHLDPITEAMRYDKCEAEVLQAIGRARSINQPEPIEVLTVNDLFFEDLPEPVHEVRWSDFLRYGHRAGGTMQGYVDTIASRQKDGDAVAVPFGKTDMAMLAPSSWSTPKAAERARQKTDVDMLELPAPKDWKRVKGRYWKSNERRGSPLIGAVKRSLNDVASAVHSALAPLVGAVRIVKIDENRLGDGAAHM